MAHGIESRFIFGRNPVDGQLYPFAVDEHGYVLLGGTGTGGASITVTDEWEIVTLSDVATNDSDKLFAVPVGYLYQVLWIYAELASSATAGNRNMAMAITDNAGTKIFEVRVGVTQAASLTYIYSLAPSLADLTGVRDTTFVMTPIPPTLILNPLQQIRVWDQNAVDAGADDLSVYIQVARRVI